MRLYNRYFSDAFYLGSIALIVFLFSIAPPSLLDGNSDFSKILGSSSSSSIIYQSVLAQPIELSKQQAIETYQTQFCGLNTVPNSNQYVQEIKLNNKCEMPLAITADVNGIWYVSTKLGSLILYNYNDNSFVKYDIPIWGSRDKPIDNSNVWDIKNDPSGANLWFTDEKQNLIWKFNKNSKTFENFKIPAKDMSFGTIYPVSLDFDNNGNIYFVGIRSASLWIGNINEMKGGTSNGISSVPLPTEIFGDIDKILISTGSLLVDKEKNDVWISMLAFGYKGQILKYNIEDKTIKKYDIGDLPSPVAMAFDEEGNIWGTDHGTSIFFKLNPVNGSLTKFVTSPSSIKITGGVKMEGNSYTLPYWIKAGSNNSLIFNEHTGNKIAKFFPDSLTLVEYWIPSQNKYFSKCPVDSSLDTCGIGNVLQFTPEYNNNETIWFTEWSENKIGKLDTTPPLPFSVSAGPDRFTVKQGNSIEIKMDVSAHKDITLNPISSSTFTPTGDLGTSYGIFSENKINLKSGDSKELSYVLTVSNDVPIGDHVLMVGAEDDSISISKAISIKVT